MFRWFFSLIFFGAAIVSILTAITGTASGYIIARGITRRLQGLSNATTKWGQGDFSQQVLDPSQDELGQMTRQLNTMAGQLQQYLQARQQLATLEERNRLARDLHDSVKQQVFALSMQIATIKHFLRRDVDAAEQRLQKMEKLVKEAQQELTSLIRELRPVALEGKNLAEALRELLVQWSQQSEIVANLSIEGSQTVPLMVEEALFRVVQEALSNIARHSQATLVQVTLHIDHDKVMLTIQDNGHGFDPAHLEKRGLGLHSMLERMKALGGDVTIESSSGEGTIIVAHCTRLGIDASQAVPEPMH